MSRKLGITIAEAYAQREARRKRNERLAWVGVACIPVVLALILNAVW